MSPKSNIAQVREPNSSPKSFREPRVVNMVYSASELIEQFDWLMGNDERPTTDASKTATGIRLGYQRL